MRKSVLSTRDAVEIWGISVLDCLNDGGVDRTVDWKHLGSGIHVGRADFRSGLKEGGGGGWLRGGGIDDDGSRLLSLRNGDGDLSLRLSGDGRSGIDNDWSRLLLWLDKRRIGRIRCVGIVRMIRRLKWRRNDDGWRDNNWS